MDTYRFVLITFVGEFYSREQVISEDAMLKTIRELCRSPLAQYVSRVERKTLTGWEVV